LAKSYTFLGFIKGYIGDFNGIDNVVAERLEKRRRFIKTKTSLSEVVV
jgi:hypothetical protein